MVSFGGFLDGQIGCGSEVLGVDDAPAQCNRQGPVDLGSLPGVADLGPSPTGYDFFVRLAAPVVVVYCVFLLCWILLLCSGFLF